MSREGPARYAGQGGSPRSRRGGRAGCSTWASRSEVTPRTASDLLELLERSRPGGNGTAGARAASSCAGPRRPSRTYRSDLGMDTDAELDDALRQPAGGSARRRRSSSRPASARSSRAASRRKRLDGALGKVVASTRRLDPEDNPLADRMDARRERSGRTGHRNLQVGRRSTRGPARCGRRARGARWATRSTRRARARTTAGRRSRTASSNTAARSARGGPSARRHGAAPIYYWDSGDRAVGDGVLRPPTSFPAWKGSLFVGGLREQVTSRRLVARRHARRRRRSACSPIARASATCASAPRARLYLLTTTADDAVLNSCRRVAERVPRS
jgi:hypothetical protein